MDQHEQHIDAVITWVDGNDPEHRRKRSEALARQPAGSQPAARNRSRQSVDQPPDEHNPNRQSVDQPPDEHNPNRQSVDQPPDEHNPNRQSVDQSPDEHNPNRQSVDQSPDDHIPNRRPDEYLPTGRDQTRFIDNNELEYCIKSIRTFAPWIRTIHVVTDRQIPSFLTPRLRRQHNIRIVDHTEIFHSHEWALPTFNSRTVETALWRIPDLAPAFIYFNDDFLLTRPTFPEHFFPDDRVVLRGKWNAITNYGPVRMRLNDMATRIAKRYFGITRSMNLLMQILSAQRAGFTDRYFRTPHVPHPVRTDTLRTYFRQNPSAFEENIAYPFRNTAQFSAIYLAHHLEIKNRKAVLEKADDFLMINGEMDPRFLVRWKLRQITNQKVRFACLHGFESFDETDQAVIRKEIGKQLPDWE